MLKEEIQSKNLRAFALPLKEVKFKYFMSIFNYHVFRILKFAADTEYVYPIMN